MRILTLWEPWATLVALSEKRIETRSWGTPYRGRLAIHASQRPVDVAVMRMEPFRYVLEAYGLRSPADFALGVIVCVTTLVDVIPTDGIEITEAVRQGGRFERSFGNYGAGRKAWIMAPRPVALSGTPVVCRGHQGLWTPSPALVGEIAQRLAA